MVSDDIEFIREVFHFCYEPPTLQTDIQPDELTKGKQYHMIQPRTTFLCGHCIAVGSKNLATIHPGGILTQLLGEVIFTYRQLI
jgi:hypothetical protein